MEEENLISTVAEVKITKEKIEAQTTVREAKASIHYL